MPDQLEPAGDPPQSGLPDNADGPVRSTPHGGSAPTCGAETRKCHYCGCHQQLHAVSPETGTKRGPCENERCRGQESGEPCPGFKGRKCSVEAPLFSNGRCRVHGGPTPNGIAASQYRTGTYSKVLPRRLKESYERALQDPQLLSVRHEIAVMRAHVEDALRRANVDGDAGKKALTAAKLVVSRWKKFADLFDLSEDSEQGLAAVEFAESVGRLEEAIDPAKSAAEARDEFRKTAESLEKLARSENQRVEMLYNVITTERALALRAAETRAFLDALERHVTDPSILRAIKRDVQAQFERLAGRRDAAAVESGAGESGGAGDGSEAGDSASTDA